MDVSSTGLFGPIECAKARRNARGGSSGERIVLHTPGIVDALPSAFELSTAGGIIRERAIHGRERDVKVREVIRLIEDDGRRLVATRGSHRQFKHASKKGRVTIAGKPSADLAPGTLNSILKQAGLAGTG